MCLQQDGRVLHRLGERADVVERRGEGDQAVARDAAVGRHQPDHAAERCRLANRAAGIGAQRRHSHSRRHRRRRTARGSAGNARQIARIVHRAVAGVLVRRAHGELVAVGLAEHDRAGGFQARHRGAVVGRNEVAQDLRAGSGAHAAHDHHVFDGDGHAGQRRQRIALVGDGVDLRGFLQRALAGERQERANLLVRGFDFLVEALRQARQRRSAAPERRCGRTRR